MVKKSAGKDADGMFETIAQGWLEKLAAFERIVADRGLKEATVFPEDAPDGAIALTFSGSLVTIGPLSRRGRRIAYASIGGRTDVPEIQVKDNARLDGDLGGYAPAKFIKGPVKQTSPLYKIAMVPHVASGEGAAAGEGRGDRGGSEIDQEAELLAEVSRLLSLDSGGGSPTIVGE